MAGSSPSRRLLTAEEISSQLRNLEGWSLGEKSLDRTFNFSDFDKAFAFMTRVAELATLRNHHPDWCQRWGRVDISLGSHDLGGISMGDVELAQAIGPLASEAGSS